MSDLFKLDDGTDAASGEKEYEGPSGSFELIPEGTSVLAMIDEAKWYDPGYDHGSKEERIELRWAIIAPDEYENRKIYQKLWVTDDDPNAKDADKAAKKRDRAKRMLAAIDANSGNKLNKVKGMPSSDDLMKCLSNKLMVIKLMIWSMPDRDNPGEKIEGNWVAAVSPKTTELEAPPAKKEKAASEPIDDEIPF